MVEQYVLSKEQRSIPTPAFWSGVAYLIMLKSVLNQNPLARCPLPTPPARLLGSLELALSADSMQDLARSTAISSAVTLSRSFTDTHQSRIDAVLPS